MIYYISLDISLPSEFKFSQATLKHQYFIKCYNYNEMENITAFSLTQNLLMRLIGSQNKGHYDTAVLERVSSHFHASELILALD